MSGAFECLGGGGGAAAAWAGDRGRGQRRLAEPVTASLAG